jgi:hypothetical protein
VESNSLPRKSADSYLKENGLEDKVLVLASLEQIENNLHGNKVNVRKIANCVDQLSKLREELTGIYRFSVG